MGLVLEHELINEIMEAYGKRASPILHDERQNLFEYYEIIKLMEMLKTVDVESHDRYKEIIKNSLLLILNLFYLRPDDDDDPWGREVSKEEQGHVRSLMRQAFEIVDTV